MLHLGLDGLDAEQVEATALANGRGRRRRYDTRVRERFARGGFHLQPTAVFVFIRPDRSHRGPGITSNQCGGPFRRERALAVL